MGHLRETGLFARASPRPRVRLQAAENPAGARGLTQPRPDIQTPDRGTIPVVKIIASNIRKGNVLEGDNGQLYTVMKSETFRPGKGTPTTSIEMRRISDGIKTVMSYKTTDQVERAFVEEVKHTYLYKDDQNYIFMNPESFEQVGVSADMLDDMAQWLDENMEVFLLMFDGRPVSIELPQRVTLEIAETEPVTKGQTASGSYKPAKLVNGARIMVPPHIGTGTRVVVNTDDGSYQERAKD
jgi:elongation factor P